MSIFSVVNDILAAGVGVTDGIGGVFKATAGDVANTIARNKSLQKFSSMGLKATQDFTADITDTAGNIVQKKFKKGAAITAGSFDEMQEILDAAGGIGGSGKIASSRYIDTSKLKAGSSALEAANKKNQALDEMIDNFNTVRENVAIGAYDGLDFAALGADDSLRTMLGRTTDKQKGIGLGNLASGYFNDATKGSARTKGVIGGAMGGAVGLRFLQGGDITHNARGENDIAGIPFF